MDVPREVEGVAEAIGFNEPLPVDVRTEESQFPHLSDQEAPLRAYAGIGQGDVNATPLQMALVAATVARGGEVPRPRLVREILDQTGSPVRAFEPETLGQAMSADVANVVTQMMVAVVESGTGTASRRPTTHSWRSR
jgi:peptidoglycan glycosyltransferase